MEQKAEEKTSFLENRINLQSSQKIDLNEWVFAHADISKTESALELCCGTGKQTEYIAALPSIKKLTCLDISQDAVDSVKAKSFWKPEYKALAADMNEYLKKSDDTYDLVFVSYGLYYSKDIDELLQLIYTKLNPGGKLIVVGPHGNNNKPLFDLLTSCGVEFPPLVAYSSRDFMYQEVMKFGEYNFQSMNIQMMVNPVGWDSMDKILTYWKNSTFFSEAAEEQVTEKLKLHFQNNEEFINEKHVMFAELTK